MEGQPVLCSSCSGEHPLKPEEAPGGLPGVLELKGQCLCGVQLQSLKLKKLGRATCLSLVVSGLGMLASLL